MGIISLDNRQNKTLEIALESYKQEETDYLMPSQ